MYCQQGPTSVHFSRALLCCFVVNFIQAYIQTQAEYRRWLTNGASCCHVVVTLGQNWLCFPTRSEFYMEIWGNMHLPRESTETAHQQFCPAAQWHRGVPACPVCLLGPEPHSCALELHQQSLCLWCKNPTVQCHLRCFILTACFRLIFKQFNSTLCWFAVKWMNFLPPL